jgi:cytochrome c
MASPGNSMTARSLLHLIAVAALASSATVSLGAQATPPRVLVFSKTAGYRHASIEPGIAAIKKLGQENTVAVDATEDAGAFNERNLRQYHAVVFLNTTGDVLDAKQQEALERYIQAGGGWVGIHAATDTEYEWPWYGRLAGAYFNGHPNNPNVRRGTFRVLDKAHPATEAFPDRWEREDEFYNFKSIAPDIRVLVDIDETSYQGGTNGARHPMSWYHPYDGGRAFYTNMGHTEASFSEPLFLRHLLGGLRWAMGTGALDYRRARPEENRFTRVVLASALNEPTELAVLPDERVLFVERRGAIKLYRPGVGVTTIATIPVHFKNPDGSDAEDGLLGVALDPNFATNGFVYMYYSPAGLDAKNVLSRFTMRGDAIDLGSEKVMLEVPVQREKCCHTGGSMAFDARGNLYLSTGDNTNPFATGYAPIDERPGRGPWDAQKSSSNTNDLRGKILRIHPEPDGSYTIPEGNFFPREVPFSRREIYTMGHRNPYRISVDKRTGWVYWGDVGPDASVDSVNRGPAGHDEIGQARRPGNFGWPYFVGDNKAYWKTAFVDSVTVRASERFDPARPLNWSPNNTGLTDLPPAEKAFIWYPYGPSDEFPMLGNGGRTAMAGPVYYRGDFRTAARPFPDYYDGKLFIYEWMRGWIVAVTMHTNGDLASMERFMPSTKFANPMDMEFGPNGDLYMLEYGTIWFSGNDDARLVRIEYTAGNRKPIVAASVDKPAGALPHRVALSSKGTIDLDDDSLRYAWTITRANGRVVHRLNTANPTVTLPTSGVYTAALLVTDAFGARDSAKVRIAAGNEPPTVDIDLEETNRTFFFHGVPIRYAVRVTDREDGTLQSGRIPARRVVVNAHYLKDGVPKGTSDEPDSTQLVAFELAAYDAGRRMVEAATCLSCHQLEKKSIGPTYMAVAQKYRNDSTAMTRLVRKIRGGGSGVWGEVTMPGHPQLSETQASQMVGYILSLAEEKKPTPSLPTHGAYDPPAAPDSGMSPAIVVRAAYADRGANGVPAIAAQKTVVLRAPTVVVATADTIADVQKYKGPEVPIEITMGSKSGAYVGFKQLDLTGVTAIVFSALAPVPQVNATGGKVEVRLDSATGPLVGETPWIQPTETMAAPTQLKAALQPTTGVRDVYFVFRNAEAPQGRTLFVLMTATFVSSK